MFAPEGYETFGRMDERFRQWAEQLKPEPEAVEERLELHESMRTAFCERHPLFLASPTGVTVETERRVMWRNHPSEWGPGHEHAGPYLFLTSVWTISAARGNARIRAAQEELKTFWEIEGVTAEALERPSVQESLGGIAELALAKDTGHSLTPFEGWALCVRESDIPHDASALGLAEAGAAEAGPRPARSKVSDNEIIREIVRLFDSGVRLKRDEYQARLAPDEGQDAWKALWKMAVEQRPALSRPGPKPNGRAS